MKSRRFSPVVSVGLIFFCLSCTKPIPLATLILKGGYIYTVCPERKYVQALAIKGDRILAIGTDQDMDRVTGPETEVIDLKGRFACPGFNDAHLHLGSGVLARQELDLTDTRSVQDIGRAVAERYIEIRKTHPGGWTIGRGWDQTRYPNNEWPTKHVLDRFVREAPVFLRRIGGHVAVANSKALEIAGINRDTPDPPGGRIVRDERTGEPNGILEEKAMDLIVQYLPSPSEAQVTSALETMLQELKSFGITSIQDQSDSITYAVYAKLLDEGRLTCRISMWMPLEADLSRAKRLRSKYRGPMLHAGLLKEYVDGTLGSRTASLFRPYADAPETYGLTRLTQNELNLLVLNADKEDFQIGIHAIGDRGNRMVLDAFELVRELNGTRDSRHRIEHAQVLTPEDIPRFAQLGVIASMQPSHCMTDMRWAEHRLGTQRCLTAYAWNDLLSSGARLAFGTDWPVAPLDPLIGLYTAVTRRDTTGFPPEGWFSEQRLNMEDAINAYTLGSAYAEFDDAVKGSLEPGKFADIVVLDRNLLRVAPQDILKTKVIYTILGGEIIYQSTQTND